MQYLVLALLLLLNPNKILTCEMFHDVVFILSYTHLLSMYSLQKCVYVWAYMHACMHTGVHEYMCMCGCACVCVRECAWVHACMCICVCVRACVWMCVYLLAEEMVFIQVWTSGKKVEIICFAKTRPPSAIWRRDSLRGLT